MCARLLMERHCVIMLARCLLPLSRARTQRSLRSAMGPSLFVRRQKSGVISSGLSTGEYINTTHFVTEPSSLDQFEFTLTANAIHELAVFTDGIEPLVLQYATNAVHSSFFNKMLPPVRALAQPGFDTTLSDQLSTYLSSPVICSRTDDDKTLLLASRLKTV